MNKWHRDWRDRHWRHWQRGASAAESAFASANPHRLRRHRRGKLLGVCAGIADYFGMRHGVVRALTIVGFIFFPWFVGLAYIALAFFLPQQSEAEVEPPREEKEFWRNVTIKPSDTFSALRFRFRELEERLAALETEVTHPDYNLKRQFRDLN
jgi:phage shock protein C